MRVPMMLACSVLGTGLMVSPHASAEPPITCGKNLAAYQIATATQHLAPYPGTDWRWSTDPRATEGNFDPCVALSTALVTVEGATAGSPVAALMFHNGEYLGTATSKAHAFTSLNTARTTDDTVVLDYKTPGACSACPAAAVTSVRYQWQGDHVVMLDPPPAG
ncbi:MULTISPECIES: LppP/LprE family lipoprotein [unclassified Mycolicibacterium]|uniref:LppP/LprE family lipoprotein n=1 Tax=unclassified Mycolicibacterium TaxID=2636767 RepID=UPI002ED89CE0